MKTLKSSLLASALILLSPIAANAALIEVSFEAINFTDNRGDTNAPDSIVSGSFVYEAADFFSQIDSLISIDLVIAGTTYGLSDVGTYEFPSISGINGLLNGTAANSGTNDFFFSFNYGTNTPQVILYTTPGTNRGWRTNDFSSFSRNLVAVPEPSTLALLGLGLLGAGAARRRKKV